MLALLTLPLLLVCTQARMQDGLLEDILDSLDRQPQYQDYPQYSDSLYDSGEPLAAVEPRALHQGEIRQAAKQGKQIKSSMLPAYCDPPNPCPLGYTAQDGCIEDFENNSEFSQKYQASQNCMCDTEHMFSCPEQMMKQQENDFSFLGLAREPGLPAELEASQNCMCDTEHMFSCPEQMMKQQENDFSFLGLAREPEGVPAELENPFLTGSKLPIAAKKGFGF